MEIHVLPKGLMRIRHYGFPANRCKNDNLKKCRKFLGLEPSDKIILTKTVGEIMLDKTGTDITKCPFCKQGTLIVVSAIPKHSGINPYEIIHPKRTHNLIQRE
jgi:hypothetical protein